MNFEEILKAVFGEGNVAVTDIIAIVSMVLTPIISVFYNKMKNKLLASDQENNAQVQKINQLESAVGYLANIVSTAYLSSNTIPTETKKVIGGYAQKLDKIAQIDLTGETKKLIEVTANYVPNINDKKEEILKATEQAEEVIDTVNEATQNAIDKLKL